MMDHTGKEYLVTATRRMKYYRDLAERSFVQLQDADFHYRPGAESNSIAVIIQHMAGNMLSRWTNFLTEDGEKEWRHRDREFETRDQSRQELLELWNRGWDCFLGALESLRGEDLLRTVHIREEAMSAIDAINRQLAHYPYHVGQIVFLAKMIRDREWQNLSIPRGQSDAYNQSSGPRDPAKNY